MFIRLYKIKEKDESGVHLPFHTLKWMRAHGGIRREYYDERSIFEGEVAIEELEELYRKPALIGREIRTGDIITTEDGAFYNDACGFANITSEFKE